MVMTAQDTKQKPGYKRTEVGVIPEDWEAKTFGEVMTGFTSGVTPSRKQPDFYKGNIRWITSGELNYNVIMDTIEKISVEAVSKTNLKLLPKGTLLIAITGMEAEGTRGSCGIVGAEATTNQHCMALFPTKQLSTHYLFHYYVYKGKSLALQYCQGTKQQDYTGKIVKLLPILLPPLPEQIAIAAVLSDMDDLITSLDRLIAKKRDIKQATMQQLLTGKTRLPGFSEKWEMKKVGEIAEIGMGRTPSRRNQNYWGRGYKWLSIADLKSKHILDTKEEITAIAASDMTVIPKGTLVMSFKLTIGKLAFTSCDMYSNEAICSFAKLRADAEYLYYTLGQTDFSLYGKQAVKGYTLNTDSLNSVQILYPPLPEQQAIASILTDMDAEIAAIEQKRDKTHALKQGMMQELLTGKTRLI